MSAEMAGRVMRLVPADGTTSMFGALTKRVFDTTDEGRLIAGAWLLGSAAEDYQDMLAAAPNGGRVSRADVERVAKGIARQSVHRHMLWANMPPPTAEHADAVADAEWRSFVDYAEAALRALGLEIEPTREGAL